MLSLSDIDNYVRRYRLITDSIRSLNATESVAKIHALYNYSLREKENSELRQKNKETLYFIVFSALLFVPVVLFLFYLNEKNKKKYVEYKRLSEHLEHMYSVSSEEYDMKEQCYENRIRKLELALDEAVKEPAVEEDSVNTKKMRIYGIIRKRIEEHKNVSYKDWIDIDKLMDEVFPDFKEKIYNICNINAREYRICMLVKLGFMNSDIATIMCRTTGTLSSSRATLYKKFFKRNGSAKDFNEFVKRL